MSVINYIEDEKDAGHLIEVHRQMKGLSRTQLGKMAGVSSATVRNLEEGREMVNYLELANQVGQVMGQSFQLAMRLERNPGWDINQRRWGRWSR